MSNRQQLSQYVDNAISGLKDFQSSTVDAVYSQLFQNGQRCMLVADEVGLGKTIVAKGIIARRLKERLEEGKRTPLRVTYICSNQVIAHENIRKLNLFPASIHMKRPVSRLAFLARGEEEYVEPGKQRQNLLELNSLTPATSFEVQKSSGIKEERAIIYALLCRDRKMLNRDKGLQWLLRGGVEKMRPYQNYLERMYEREYQPDLPKRYIRQLKRERLPKSQSTVYDHLSGWRERSVYEAVVDFAEMLRDRRAKRIEKELHRGCLVLIHELRRILIRCCLRYVNADLYILDEFQRFRDLIDLDNDEERAIIAREVLLSKQSSRVLLLSATPFKAFTDHDDLDRGEDHYRDFRSVLRFLLRDREDCLAHYDEHRHALYKQLLDLRKGEIDSDPTHRHEVETLLRSVMCRTERNSVADDPAIMIEDQWREPVTLSVGDIDNYRHADKIVQALNRLKLPTGKPIEYCKSSLYPFSYLDRYKVKQLLADNKHKPEIESCLRATKEAWLDMPSVNRYQFTPNSNGSSTGPSNARLSLLIEKAIGERGAELLWVPPSLPYYRLTGSFAGMERFSKTLLFSAWVMVPRVIGTLLSYEVERQTVGNEATREANEKEERTYFTPEGKRRHPVPQIRFSRSGRDRDAQLRNMSNFCLLYPSVTLSDAVDPVANLQEGLTLEQLRVQTTEALRREINKAKLGQYSTKGGDSERWYWAAPLLLDRSGKRLEPTLKEWFWEGQPQHDPWGRKTFFRGAAENASAKEKHFEHLKQCWSDPDSAGLGTVPEDLAEVLADLALGSPAVLTLRSLRRMFPDQHVSDCLVGAFDAADEFTNLFNKPESIAAVRLGVPRKSYWRMVANYCASGCLQAVLDEYFHVLTGQNVDAEGAIEQLRESVNLDTASINVDGLDTFLDDEKEPRKMRCHYAVEFGSQRLETDEGGKRATNLREVFNSPFRPFVLATTSIGQEGLDFHSYCRRIVHWNLPGNPIDLEQREGRINRYKGLVIRQFLAAKYGDQLGDIQGDVWQHLFTLADKHERHAHGKCELVPYWHVETNDIKIERVIPFYPYSSDQAKLTKILKTLAVYRLAFGQPRQAELVEHLLEHDFSEQDMKQILNNLMIDLSPIRYRPPSSCTQQPASDIGDLDRVLVDEAEETGTKGQDMELLKKGDIIAHVREKGVSMSHEALREYLMERWDRIDGLVLKHHENVDKNRVNNHWYEIVSNVSQDRANRLVAEQIIKDRSKV